MPTPWDVARTGLAALFVGLALALWVLLLSKSNLLGSRERMARPIIRRWNWATVLVLVVGGLATLAIAAVLSFYGSAPVPVVLDCEGGTPTERPTGIILACGDGGIWAVDLSWSRWNSRRAIAVGSIAIRVCVPDCAGSTHSDMYAADFILGGVQQIARKTYFTTLQVKFSGASPGSSHDVTCHLVDSTHHGGCVTELTD